MSAKIMSFLKTPNKKAKIIEIIPENTILIPQIKGRYSLTIQQAITRIRENKKVLMIKIGSNGN